MDVIVRIPLGFGVTLIGPCGAVPGAEPDATPLVFTAPGFYVFPWRLGFRSALIELTAGGGGAGGSDPTSSGGGGGGGGAFASSIVSGSFGQTRYLTVGSGGAGGAGGAGIALPGMNGTASNFETTTIVADAGKAPLTFDGFGERGKQLNSVGTLKRSGGNGAPPVLVGGGGGASGSAAGVGGAGNTSGAGGVPAVGGGAGGAGTTSPGGNGFSPGGGGGGASGSGAGGAGGAGRAVVSWIV